jgi:hypothetical protein
VPITRGVRTDEKTDLLGFKGVQIEGVLRTSCWHGCPDGTADTAGLREESPDETYLSLERDR